MKLGVQVGLSPGHIVLDGDSAPPPPKGLNPQFLAHICYGQVAGWIKMPLGMEVGLGPGHIVLYGDPDPPLQKRDSPNFRTVFVVAKWLDGSRYHLVRR